MKTRDWILCLAVLLIWSSSSSLVSVFTNKSNPVLLAGIISIISSIILSIQMINTKQRKILRSVKLSELCKLIVPSLLGMFLYPIAYFIGISGSSAIKANVLNYLWPLIAFIISGLLKKHRFLKSEILSMVLATIGGYVVLCFNNSSSIIFNSSDYIYVIIALMGAFFYGIYTATIGFFVPKVSANIADVMKTDDLLPANLRIYVMISFSAILHMVIIIICLIVNPDVVRNTMVGVFSYSKSSICLIIYSIINFTIAHFLWNKLNTSANVALTSSMAFLIPLLSTVVLSISSGETIGLAPSIGLTLIVISIIINNRKYINSINSTFASIIVFFMFVSIVPSTNNESFIENSKFFLEIIIALYSIYYGFVMSRVINDYKELENLIDVISINKRNISFSNREKLKKIERNLISLKKQSKEDEYINFGDKITTLIPQDLDSDMRLFFEKKYYLLYRHSNHALSISEWLVILILSILILLLCFVVRENNLLSSIVVISIGSAISLCVSSLYEYEVKRSMLLACLGE